MLYGHYLGEIQGVLSGLLRGIIGVQSSDYSSYASP